jgi:hypothetical protein
MDEFSPLGRNAMSSDETAKIEPTLIVTDSPSITTGENAKPEVAAETAKIEEKPEAKIEEPKVEAVAPEAKAEAPKVEAATLPPAPQIDPVVVPFKKPEPAAVSAAPVAPQARSSRFALLAACVAIAASFGAIGGSLGVATFGPTVAAAPPAAPPAKEQVAEEVKALKDSVAQLRAATKALNDNFAALKTTVAGAGTQNGKIAEALERIEKAQTEQRKMAAAASPETTGSIVPKQAAVPMVLGDPPTTLKPLTVPGYVLRRVYDGAALIEGRDGIIEVEPGMVAPGLGRIEAIRQQGGRWVVVTARGLVVSR